MRPLLFCLYVEATDSCIAYTVLAETWRTPWTNGQNSLHCDVNTGLLTGWYRFLLNNNNANMLMYAPPIYSCGTHAPVWWNGKLPQSDFCYAVKNDKLLLN